MPELVARACLQCPATNRPLARSDGHATPQTLEATMVGPDPYDLLGDHPRRALRNPARTSGGRTRLRGRLVAWLLCRRGVRPDAAEPAHVEIHVEPRLQRQGNPELLPGHHDLQQL